MKSINIQPLTLSDNLKLRINRVIKTKVIDESKSEEVLKQVTEFLAANKVPSMIISKSMAGTTPAVATNVKTNDGHIFQFPEPNPVHLYFQNANKHLSESVMILARLKEIPHVSHELQYLTFNEYFNEVTTGITFLGIAIEAFINQQIPEDYGVNIDENTTWDKAKMEWKDLKTKIKIILPAFFQKNFLDNHQQEYILILEMQDLRNDLVHLKTEFQANKTFYENIIKRLLDFEPDKYVDAVFLFVNFWKQGYFVENNNVAIEAD